MLLRARVGSVVFNGLATTGFIIGPDGFVGWDDSTPTKRQLQPRSQAHGSFPQKGYRDVRTVVISGTCVADSEQQLEWFGSQLTGLLSDGSMGTITVDHSGVTSFANCFVDGQPTFAMFGAGAAALFTAQFWCPDPRKFGTGNAYGPATALTVFHYGNFAAAPVLTIAGSMPSGYTITGPSEKVYTVTAAVTAAAPHTIDMSTGYLTINGVIQTGVVTVGNTWTVAPGAQVAMTLTPVSGTGTLSATVTDTYV